MHIVLQPRRALLLSGQGGGVQGKRSDARHRNGSGRRRLCLVLSQQLRQLEAELHRVLPGRQLPGQASILRAVVGVVDLHDAGVEPHAERRVALVESGAQLHHAGERGGGAYVQVRHRRLLDVRLRISEVVDGERRVADDRPIEGEHVGRADAVGARDVVQLLGEAPPLNIVVLPVLFEGEVKAVLELASFEEFNDIHLTFLDQLTESIGIVPFVDAGQVYDTVYPDFSVDEPLRYGAGLGLRYYTAIGPVRLDVAVPLNPRETNDNAFEIYISLGQAF